MPRILFNIAIAGQLLPVLAYLVPVSRVESRVRVCGKIAHNQNLCFPHHRNFTCKGRAENPNEVRAWERKRGVRIAEHAENVK